MYQYFVFKVNIPSYIASRTWQFAGTFFGTLDRHPGTASLTAVAVGFTIHTTDGAVDGQTGAELF